MFLHLRAICLSVLLCLSLSAAAQRARSNLLTPFRVWTEDDAYDLVLPLGENDVKLLLSGQFSTSQEGYTPEAVEDLIDYVLEQTAPELSHTVITGIDGENVYIGTGNEIYQKIFLDRIAPVLLNAAQLRKYIAAREAVPVDAPAAGD